MIITLYVITESPLILSLTTVFALAAMVPANYFRKISGYLVLVDVTTSAYIFSSFIGVGALGAISVAAFTPFFISIALRLMRQYAGAEMLSVNGSTEYRLVFAELATQCVRWVKAFAKALTTGRVDAPEKLAVQWVEVQTGSSLNEMFASLFTKTAVQSAPVL